MPTIIELKDETVDYAGSHNLATGAVKVINRDTAFKNFLKLPANAARSVNDGSHIRVGIEGHIWSSSFEERISFKWDGIMLSNAYVPYGFGVRCIKN